MLWLKKLKEIIGLFCVAFLQIQVSGGWGRFVMYIDHRNGVAPHQAIRPGWHQDRAGGATIPSSKVSRPLSEKILGYFRSECGKKTSKNCILKSF